MPQDKRGIYAQYDRPMHPPRAERQPPKDPKIIRAVAQKARAKKRGY